MGGGGKGGGEVARGSVFLTRKGHAMQRGAQKMSGQCCTGGGGGSGCVLEDREE